METPGGWAAPGISVTIGGSHLGKASHVPRLGKRSGAAWTIAGEELWWPTPRPEVIRDLLGELQRAASVEFDHQATHDAGALKRLSQAQIDLPVQWILADVAQPLPSRCRSMVNAFAVHRPDSTAAVEDVVAAVRAVVRLARDAVLDRPGVHAEGVGDHVVPVLQPHDSALVELVGLAHQVQVLLIRCVQPCGMLPYRGEPLGDALVVAMPGVGVGHGNLRQSGWPEIMLYEYPVFEGGRRAESGAQACHGGG